MQPGRRSLWLGPGLEPDAPGGHGQCRATERGPGPHPTAPEPSARRPASQREEQPPPEGAGPTAGNEAVSAGRGERGTLTAGSFAGAVNKGDGLAWGWSRGKGFPGIQLLSAGSGGCDGGLWAIAWGSCLHPRGACGALERG